MAEVDSPNRYILRAVARKIYPLLPDVVFVGGQVVELYLTDRAAVRVRSTVDVDVVVAGARSDYHRMEERLRELDFMNDQSPGAPICRWRSRDGYLVDLMPVDETILGFSNEWYSDVVEQHQKYEIGVDLWIAIPRPAIFIATKLAAFSNRGNGDLLGSPDLEDVITIVAGRPELVDELRAEPVRVRSWIAAEMRGLLNDPDFDYAVVGALPDAAGMPAYREDVVKRFQAIASTR